VKVRSSCVVDEEPILNPGRGEIAGLRRFEKTRVRRDEMIGGLTTQRASEEYLPIEYSRMVLSWVRFCVDVGRTRW